MIWIGSYKRGNNISAASVFSRKINIQQVMSFIMEIMFLWKSWNTIPKGIRPSSVVRQRRPSSTSVRRRPSSVRLPSVFRRRRTLKLYKGTAFQKQRPFPQGVQKEEIQKYNNGDKHGHGQEKKRTWTLCLFFSRGPFLSPLAGYFLIFMKII